MFSFIYILHLSFCLFMTGLIWLIQLVHYPSFKYVDPNQFITFEKFHSNTITFIVLPIMTLELLSGLSLLIIPIDENFKDMNRYLNFINISGIGLIWLSTAFLSVPLHAKLTLQGFNLDLINQLVLTNWPRTLLWSARSLFLIFSFILTQKIFDKIPMP